MLTDAYAALALCFATRAVPLGFSAGTTAAVWALEGAGVAWLGIRQNRTFPWLAGLALVAGGIVHGSLLAGGASAQQIAGFLFWFRLVLGAGIGLSGLAATIATLNVFLMYTSARPADYAVIGEGAPLPAAR